MTEIQFKTCWFCFVFLLYICMACVCYYFSPNETVPGTRRTEQKRAVQSFIGLALLGLAMQSTEVFYIEGGCFAEMCQGVQSTSPEIQWQHLLKLVFRFWIK